MLLKILNNMKYRLSFTIQDYYSYMGTNPNCTVMERMLLSIPDEFRKSGYNIKFKTIKKYNLFCWSIYYRVHMSVKMSEEEIKKVIEYYENCSHTLSNFSYKLITKHF